MKRFLVLFLVLSMLLAGISAAFAQDAPAEIVVPEGRILVKYWSPYGSGSSAWIDENAINVFNAAQDKYFVVREYNGGYYDQIAKLMATEQKDLPAFCNSAPLTSSVAVASTVPLTAVALSKPVESTTSPVCDFTVAPAPTVMSPSTDVSATSPLTDSTLPFTATSPAAVALTDLP